MEDGLLDALASRSCVLFAGAGLSVDCGLPIWATLASHLVSDLSARGKLTPPVANAASSLLSAGDLNSALNLVAGAAQRLDMAESIRPVLQTTTEGRCYPALKRLKLRGAITTNYDRLLERALPENLRRLNNSQGHLKLMAAAVASDNAILFKVHGDLDDALDPSDPLVAKGDAFMVLCPNDFKILIQGSRGTAITYAFHALLTRYPLFFLGYSYSDPDIQWILRFLTDQCQFAHTSWYVIPRAERAPALPPNVAVLQPFDTWQQLPEWLETLPAKVAERRSASPKPHPSPSAPDLSAKERKAFLAVSRYLSDLESDNVAERMLACVVMAEYRDDSEIKTAELSQRVESLLEVGPLIANALAGSTLTYLTSRRLLVLERPGVFRVVPSASAALQRTSQTQWKADRHQFFASVEERLGSIEPVSTEFCELLDETLQDLCIALGESLAQWVYRGIGDEFDWLEASKIIEGRFRDREEARRASEAIRLILLKPRDDEAPYLYRLLGASFLANSVRLDPNAAGVLQDALSAYELYLDTNVLLPLVISEHQRHAEVKAVIRESRQVGAQLFVMQGMVREMIAHRRLADRIAAECAGRLDKMEQVIAAHGSRANCFVQGFVNYAHFIEGKGEKQKAWSQYIRAYSDDRLEVALKAEGIVAMSFRESRDSIQFAAVLESIRSAWERRSSQQGRAAALNENEAKQFLQIYHRRQERPDRRAWFLSHETVLVEVFKLDSGHWGLPPTFPFSAWVALLDSKMPTRAERPEQVVRAILRGYPAAFSLPDATEIVRRKAFGDRVTTSEEEKALKLVTTDFELGTRLEKARKALLSRSGLRDATAELRDASREVIGEIKEALAAEVSRTKRAVALEREALQKERERLAKEMVGPLSSRHRRRRKH